MYLQNILILSLAFIGLTQGQFDGCETLTLPAHQTLNVPRFMGIWYVLKVGTRLASQISPVDVTCHESVLSLSEQENVLDFQDRYNLIENGVVTGPATADYEIHWGEVDETNPIPSIWSIYLPGGNRTIGQSLILASDEDSWALEYACFLKDGAPLGKLSFWSRHRYMEPLVEKTLNSISRSLGFPVENFVHVEHSDC